MNHWQITATFEHGATAIFGLEASDAEAAWSQAGERLALFVVKAEDLQVDCLETRR